MRMGLRLSNMFQVTSTEGKTVQSKLPQELAVQIFEDIANDFGMRGNEIVLLAEKQGQNSILD